MDLRRKHLLDLLLSILILMLSWLLVSLCEQ